ncbi:MAG TPA: zinc-dependent metalloprotease [Baekduia sp.]|uniref:zinc-dependent metalloprotease n=1 Tax=Baekduia sp. TaxID=2600305 RepID=UPI002D76DDE8|nr:zinc-dependent metalloprotease [Baekduia sp.]HET6508619.1 zinc-dependent metalloprotease [Baekduia sp.]
MQVDWELAGRIARSAAKEDPPSARPDGLDETAAAAREQVVAATLLTPRDTLPAAEWVSRGAWIDANLATMRATLGPVLEDATTSVPSTGPLGSLQNAGGAVVAAEVGALLGLFARRVLGQYELSLVDPDAPPRLLLVGPNLDRAAGELGADREELVTWVTLHEVTHAVQFGSVEWLRPRLGGALRQLLGALDVKMDPRKLLDLRMDDVKALADSVREGGLLGAVMGAERKAILDRVQGTMGLVEGHAEWAMDQAGGEVLEDVDALRAAMDRRREDRAPLLRILDRLLGFDLKLKQYQQGRVFCDAVVAARGVEGLRDVWSAEDLAPSSGELAMPAAYLARTGRRAA